MKTTPKECYEMSLLLLSRTDNARSLEEQKLLVSAADVYARLSQYSGDPYVQEGKKPTTD